MNTTSPIDADQLNGEHLQKEKLGPINIKGRMDPMEIFRL